MAAEIVGSAYVVIRAVTTKLASDIKDGLDRAVRDADIDSVGEQLGERLSRAINDNLAQSNIGETLGETVGTALSETIGETVGGSPDIGDGIEESLDKSKPKTKDKSSEIGDVLADALKRAARAQLAADGPADWLEYSREKVRSQTGPAIADALSDGLKRAAIAQLAADGPADWLDYSIQNRSPDQDGGFKRFFAGLKNLFSRGGEDGGGSFSDGFVKGFKGKNPLSKLLGAIKIPPIAILGLLAVPAIGGALQLIAAYVVALTAQVGFLATAVGGLGAAVAGFGASLILGVIPLFLAFKTATPELEAFQAAAKAVGEEWKVVGAATQSTLLPSLSRALQSSTKLIDSFALFGAVVGDIAGRTVEFAVAILTSETNQGRLNRILESATRIWDEISRAVLNVVSIILPFLDAARPLAERFATSLANIAEKFAEIINRNAESGQLTETLTLWYDRSEQILTALGDLSVGLINVFETGANVAQPFFDTFSNFADRFRTFTESAAGQSQIQQIFENALPVVREVNALIRDVIIAIFQPIVGGDTSGVIDFVRTLRVEVLPALQELGDTLGNQGPALQNFFNTLVDLLVKLSESGAIGSFLSTITTALELFVRVLENPILGAVLPKLLGILGVLKALDLITLGGATKGLAGLVSGLSSLVGLSAAFATFKTALAGVGAAFTSGGLVAGFSALKVALIPLLIPLAKFIAIAALIVGVVLLVVWAFKNWDKITEWVANAFWAVVDFVKELPSKIAEAAVALWHWIQDAIPVVLEKIGEFASTVFNAVVTFVGNIPGWIAGAATALWSWVTEAGPKLFSAWLNIQLTVARFLLSLPGKIIGWLAGAARALFSWIINAAPQILYWIGYAIGRLAGFLLTLPGKVAGWVAGAASALWNWIVNAAPQILYWIGYAIGQLAGFLISLPGKILGWVAGAAQALFQWIIDAAPQILYWIGYAIGQLLGFLLQLPVKIIGILVAAAQALWQWIVDAGPGLLLSLAGFLQTIADFLISLPGKIIGWLLVAIPAMINWIIDTIPGLLANLGQFLLNVGNFLLSLPGKIVEFLRSAIPAMINWVADAASQIPGKLAEFAGKIYTWITDFVRELPGRFASLGSTMLDIGRNIVEGIWNGISNAKDWLFDQIGGFVGGIKDGFFDALGIGSPSKVMAAEVGIPITQGIGVGILQGIDSALDAANRVAALLATTTATVPVNLVPNTGALSLDTATALSTTGTVTAGSSTVNLQVLIGDRDITDIVDSQIVDYQTAYSRQVYARGVTS